MNLFPQMSSKKTTDRLTIAVSNRFTRPPPAGQPSPSSSPSPQGQSRTEQAHNPDLNYSVSAGILRLESINTTDEPSLARQLCQV